MILCRLFLWNLPAIIDLTVENDDESAVVAAKKTLV
jgi:hypothetical protein